MGWIQESEPMDKPRMGRSSPDEAARRAPSEWKRLLEAIPLPVCHKDPEGRYTAANPAFCKLFGVEERDLVGKRAVDLFPEDQAAHLAEKDAALLESPGQQVFETRLTDARAAPHDLVFNRSTVLDDRGGITGLIGVIQEVTDRNRAVAALRESEERYRILVEHNQDGVFIIKDGRFVFVNQAFTRLAGREVEAIVGRPMIELVAPEDRAVVGARYQNRMKGENIVEAYEFHALRGESERILVHMNVGTIVIGGRPAAIGTLRDITVARGAEEALRRAHDQRRELELIIHRSPAIAFLRRATLGWPVEYVSENVQALGYSPAEIRAPGRFYATLIHPEDRARVALEVARLVEGPSDGELRIEYRLVTPSGEALWVEDRTWVRRDEKGTVTHLQGIVLDISQRKQAEEERQRLERRMIDSQRLESLGLLAGGIAHDFNNLLLAILGNLDLAALDIPASSPARVPIAQALEAGRRASDLTRQLLAYSGKGRFLLARVDLGAVLRENAELLRTAVPHSVTLSLQLAAQPAVVLADPGQMQQVVMNLITNAAEAIGEQPGVITLRTGVVEADAATLGRSRAEPPAPGRFAFAEVADTGCGMAEETLRRIFDPFFTTKFTGRGLGMSAVLGIVRGHAGAILVDTTVGRGTTIRVLFPLAAPVPAPAVASRGEAVDPAAAVVPAPRRDGAILVCDDEPLVCTLSAALVRRLGFRALSAGNGREAVRIFGESSAQIDCVLLDLTMPDQDGLTTFKALKQIDPAVRVILCSGYSEEEATERFTGEGLAAFIQKPFTLENLRAMLSRTLA
jgi:two-component system, cell cycle sensor histidine kinase and response regulator CckA